MTTENCARIELVTALHFLASNFENALYAFGDDSEARRKAEGDIAHAMSVAAKHNQNGPGCTQTAEAWKDSNPHDYPACAVFRGGKCTCDAQDGRLHNANVTGLAPAQEKTK